MWARFAGEKPGERVEGGQQLAAQNKAVAAGKIKMQAVDRPAIQKGMGSGGFGDHKVKASAASEPLWDVFKAKAKSSDKL